MILTTPNFIGMIATVVLPVTMELLSDTLEILASEFTVRALFVPGVAEFALVGAIAAIVVVVTEPTTVQTAAVVTCELVFRAGHWLRAVVKSHILVGAIHAVWIAVTEPLLWYALSTVPHLVCHTCEFRFFVALAVVCNEIIALYEEHGTF